MMWKITKGEYDSRGVYLLFIRSEVKMNFEKSAVLDYFIINKQIKALEDLRIVLSNKYVLLTSRLSFLYKLSEDILKLN
jgi:hypothetical protein